MVEFQLQKASILQYSSNKCNMGLLGLLDSTFQIKRGKAL